MTKTQMLKKLDKVTELLSKATELFSKASDLVYDVMVQIGDQIEDEKKSKAK